MTHFRLIVFRKGYSCVLPYRLTLPKRRSSAVVFSSPHSGAAMPEDFVARARLSRHALRSSEDSFVDQLFSAAPDCGAPLLSATMARSYVDLNRSEDELDPAIIQDVPRRGSNPRVAAGLGVIPRVVAEGQVIQDGKISAREAQDRIAAFHRPYHETLSTLHEEGRQRFGLSIVIDCHSMPHEALAAAPLVNGARPEIVLGDRFGASCDRWLMADVSDIFTRAGFRVARNAPFAGGYVTQSYGRPSRGLQAIQIEIDRALYMDEAAITPNADFTVVQRRMNSVTRDLADLGLGHMAIAAE